jgi:4-nitrophenyl phosphatase
MAWVLDLDGVLWLGEQPVPGSAAAVGRLRSAGERVLFATNNAWARVGDQEAKLASFGVPATGDVVTAAQAVAQLVEPGQRALVAGGPGLVEALEGRGSTVVDSRSFEPGDGQVDVVVVGFHRHFDYEGLRRAAAQIDRGARFLAANDDATYPTAEGVIPGGGSVVAAIAYATSRRPEVAGKPHRPMADLIHELVGGPGEAGMVVGDRPSTDGAFATTLGYKFGLVFSGVTRPEDLPVQPTPDFLAEDLAALVDVVL